MVDEVSLMKILQFLHLSLFQYNDRIKDMERNSEKEVIAKEAKVNKK